MKTKQTTVTDTTLRGRDARAEPNDHDPDVDICPAPKPAPFRTVVGGDRKGEEPYLKREPETMAFVIVDLEGWQLVEAAEGYYNMWYDRLLRRIWISMIAAGNQVDDMEVWVTVRNRNRRNSLRGWMAKRSDLLLFTDDLHDRRYLRAFAQVYMIAPDVLIYVTDVLEGDHQHTWDYLSSLDCIVSAHLHVYDQPVVGSSRTILEQLSDIYDQLPKQYSNKYRDVPKPEQPEKEEESEEADEQAMPEEVKAVVPKTHPAHKGDDFIRFLEKAADVYERVA